MKTSQGVDTNPRTTMITESWTHGNWGSIRHGVRIPVVSGTGPADAGRAAGESRAAAARTAISVGRRSLMRRLRARRLLRDVRRPPALGPSARSRGDLVDTPPGRSQPDRKSVV